MRAAKYLIAIWTAVLAYTGMTISLGMTGFSAYRVLQGEKDKQQQNLDALKSLNQELKNTTDALLYDKDTIAIFARELGFASKDEKFIRIVGLSALHKQRMEAGGVLSAAKPDYTPDYVLKIISLCMGIFVFITIAWGDYYLHRKKD
ncbi:MAG: septum formation initiator family protein [Treponema sp.]|jgi:cell division protein FtsB|nr:septum formation initiator family protein [Treponema sp.]